MNRRAYSLLEIKSIDEDRRIILGVATTPEPDLMDDVVEPKGAEFKLPIPFLWQHDSSSPVGHVTKAKVSASGIDVEIHLKKTDEPGLVKDRLDSAWHDIKLGLVRGLSIGFKGLETSKIEGSFGIRFLRWLWLELSGVTIAANQSASITAIKSIDAAVLAATGHKQNGSERTVSAGASAIRSTVVKAQEAKHTMKKTIAEQIAAFEATRQAKAARMSEIMDAAAEKGETLDDAGKQEYDGLDADVKAIDDHLVRLRKQEEINKVTAVAPAGENADDATKTRSGVRVENVRQNVDKGISFARLVMAKCIAAKQQISAADVAKARWPNNPEIELALKAAVDPMNSTNTSVLVDPRTLESEFIEYLWPKTIIGRIPGLRRVPFNIKVQRQTSVAAVNWVGESKPKPLGRGTLDTVTLLYFKIAGIVGITDEIVRFSNPSAEAMVRNDLANGVIKLMDHDFLDPEKAAAAGVSPASVSNGVTPTAATGTTYAHFTADVTTALGNYDAADIDTSDLVIVMNTRLARTMSLMLNALGQKSFPDLTAMGGTILGYPVITSSNVDRSEDSPIGGDNMFFLKPSDILLADDGQVSVDISREASVQMNSAPDDPTTASTVMVSAFQQNLLFVRAERFVNWLKARDEAVQYISFAAYANATA